MMFFFVKNSTSQLVLGGVKDAKNECSRPGEGDGASLLITICQHNSHGTRDSAIVAKTKLLAAETKSFNHNIQDVNKFITAKNKEIAFGGETNHKSMKAVQFRNFRKPSASYVENTTEMMHLSPQN